MLSSFDGYKVKATRLSDGACYCESAVCSIICDGLSWCRLRRPNEDFKKSDMSFRNLKSGSYIYIYILCTCSTKCRVSYDQPLGTTAKRTEFRTAVRRRRETLCVISFIADNCFFMSEDLSSMIQFLRLIYNTLVPSRLYKCK
jgi:hypothetical protein